MAMSQPCATTRPALFCRLKSETLHLLGPPKLLAHDGSALCLGSGFSETPHLSPSSCGGGRHEGSSARSVVTRWLTELPPMRQCETTDDEVHLTQRLDSAGKRFEAVKY